MPIVPLTTLKDYFSNKKVPREVEYIDLIDTLADAGGVPTTRSINTTSPLTGGGNLSADRTLSINQGIGSELDSDKFDGFHDYQVSMKDALTGGGYLSTVGGGVKWDSRFMVISAGRGTDSATSGYFAIDCPVSGVTITGVGGASNQVVGSNGIPLGAYVALYYILPFGSGSGTINGNFRLVYYNSDIQIPSNWINICRRTETGSILWGTGIELYAGEEYYVPKYGSTFPTKKFIGQRFYRSDLMLEFQNISGNVWVTTQEFNIHLPHSLFTASELRLISPIRNTMSIYVTNMAITYFVSTTNNGSNYWAVDFYLYNTTITTNSKIHGFNSSAVSPSIYTYWTGVPNTTGWPTYFSNFVVACTKIGSPGTLIISTVITYRFSTT